MAGMRAYVSFIQSYIKHQCSLVFRLKGESFLLLHLPVCLFHTCVLADKQSLVLALAPQSIGTVCAIFLQFRIVCGGLFYTENVNNVEGDI